MDFLNSFRRLSLLPPVALTLPPSSSIHDSDATSVIKSKINRRPFQGDGHEEYLTSKKVKRVSNH